MFEFFLILIDAGFVGVSVTCDVICDDDCDVDVTCDATFDLIGVKALKKAEVFPLPPLLACKVEVGLKN